MGEPRPHYGASSVEESVVERVQIQFPPYFERFLDERDRRIAAELHRLEEAIERNSQDIARVLREMDLRFAELRAEMDRRFAEMAEGQQALRAEMERRFGEVDRRFAEMAEGQQALRAEMERRFGEVDRRFAEVDRRFGEMRAEMDRRFAEVDRRLAELAEGQRTLRSEMRTHFYWTIGLLFPVVASVVAIVIRLFFGGAP